MSICECKEKEEDMPVLRFNVQITVRNDCKSCEIVRDFFTFSTRMSSSILDFPLSRFASLVGVHSLLIVFTALYLPRSSYLLTSLPTQESSKDRPQHAFLQPLTADPLLTVAWLCIGTAVVQASWAGWLKSERNSARAHIFGEDDEAKMKRKLNSGTERLLVRVASSSFARFFR